MNYGGDAADQIVRYSMDGLDHTLRLSGTMAKNLAVFLAAILKDQKKTHGRTKMIRMLKENRPLKFFTVPTDRLKEFCMEGKKRGLLYVVIRDKKDPVQSEVMVFADDAAKVNRVMDRMNLDFVKSESGELLPEVAQEIDAPVPVEKETVSMPEGEVQFEISDMEDLFGFGQDAELGQDPEPGNFTQAQEAEGKSLFEPSSRSSDTSAAPDAERDKPSVKKELEEIKKQKEIQKKKQPRPRAKNRGAGRRKKKPKSRGKGR